MTLYSDFIDASRKWVARPDHSDALMATFVRSAETRLDRRLRVKEGIVFDDAVLDADGNIAMPADYNELSFITPDGGEPLEYTPYHSFEKSVSTVGKYTSVGTTIICGSALQGKSVEIAYYQNIPAFSAAAPDTPTWLYTKYYDIFLQAVNTAALFYGQEWERSNSLSDMVVTWIDEANDASKKSPTAGSPLVRRSSRRIG